MNTKILIFGIGLILCTGINAAGQKVQSDTIGNYKLVWADEFSNEGPPDPKNWKFERGFERNHELQWYQTENAICHKGLLLIEAKKVHLPNPNYIVGSTNWTTNRQFIEYTSSSLN